MLAGITIITVEAATIITVEATTIMAETIMQVQMISHTVGVLISMLPLTRKEISQHLQKLMQKQQELKVQAE